MYQDEKNKSKEYNVVNGNKELDVGSLKILKSGRGKLTKKSIGIDMVKNMYERNYSVTTE